MIFMSKKSILIILVILAISAIIYSTGSSNELIVNNVIGVDNVKLNASMFAQPFKTSEHNDGFRQGNNFVVRNKITGDNINFGIDNDGFIETIYNGSFIFYDSNIYVTNFTLSGIKGQYIICNEMSHEYFTFSMNSKTYMIYIDSTTNSKSEVESLYLNFDEISHLLDAWLESSDYKPA